MKKTFVSISLFTLLCTYMPTIVTAQTVSDCTNPLGCVAAPKGLPQPTISTPGGGLVILFNNALRLVFVFGGIYMFIRIVIAGLKFMQSGGDPKAIQQATDSIWQSILGLIIMVSAFIVAALLGLLFFGDAGAILNPKITGPGA